MKVIDSFDAGWRRDPSATMMMDASTGAGASYGDVGKFTHRFAHAIESKGLNGAHVAVLSPNGVLMYSVVLGLLRSNAVFVPVNYRAGGPELAELLDRLDCTILFYDPDLAPVAALVTDAVPSITISIALTTEAVETWIGEQPDSGFAGNEDPEAVYAIQPTGGTTGLPKGVLMPQRYINAIVETFASVAPFDVTRSPRPIYLAAAPLTHAGGQVMQFVIRDGGLGVIMSAAKPGDILAAIERHRITHVFLPPTVIYGMLEHPDLDRHDYSSLQYVMYGAAPMSPEKLSEAVATFGPVMAQIYGQTETGVPNLYLSPADHFLGGNPANGIADIQRLASAGRPTRPDDVVLLDESGRIVGDGETGEISVRGSSVALGYYKDASGVPAVSDGGFLRTGDLAFRDSEGYFHIVDRKKDIIITGGFNVYSAEVERVLLSHPDVQEAAVFGIPDPKWGEAVTAAIEPKTGHIVDPEALRSFCRIELGPVKTPKRIEVITTMPRTATGKILKRELKEPFWAGTGRRVS